MADLGCHGDGLFLDEGLGLSLVLEGLDFLGVNFLVYLVQLGLGGEVVTVGIGEHEHDHAVVGTDKLGEGLVDSLEGHCSLELLCHLKLELDAGDGDELSEVLGVFAGVRGVLASVALLVLAVECSYVLGFGAVVFAGGEAVASGAEELAVSGLDGGTDVVALADNLEGEGVLGVSEQEGAQLERSLGEGAVGLFGHVACALVEHAVDHALDVRDCEVGHFAADFAGQELLGELEGHQTDGDGLLFVLADGVDGAFVVADTLVYAGSGVGGHLDGAEDFLDLRLDVGGVDVTDDDDGLVVGAVPRLIVVAENLGVEVVDNGHQTDGQACAVLAVGINDGQQLLHQLLLAGVGATPFLVDDTALLVDFVGGEEQAVGPVVEDEQARVNYARALHGDVGDVVDGLVDRGVGIEVLAKLYTDGLEPVDERVAGEVLGAVEAHVLEEVGQTALVFVLEDRAYLLGDEEVGLTFGVLVVTDVVGQSVGELAHDYGAVDRGVRRLNQLRHVLSRSAGAEQHAKGNHCADKEFSHNK